MTDRNSGTRANEPKNWQTRPEAGTTGGIKFLMWLASAFGRAPLRLALYPVAVYFFLVRGPERRASRNYLTRVMGRSATTLEVLKHFVCFAHVAADRFFFFSGLGDEIPVRFVDVDQVRRVVDRGDAGIFLAAHLGSFEAARVVGPKLGGIDLRIVLDQQFSGRFLQLMTEINPDLANSIIDSEQGSIELGLTIKDSLREGSWVGFLADRFRPDDRTLSVDFLGTKAPFPVGPYIIASTFNAPIICTFCRLSGNGYEVHCEVLSEQVKLPRANRSQALETLATAYVRRLEHHVRAAPFGWFNFFDFWAEQPAKPEKPGA